MSDKLFWGLSTETGRPIAKMYERQEPAFGRAGSWLAAPFESFTTDATSHKFAWRFWYEEEEGYAIRAMEILGSITLLQTVTACGGQVDAQTCAVAAEQAIRSLSFLHSQGRVCGRVMPELFLWGAGNMRHHLHLVDIGLGPRYCWNGHHVREGGPAPCLGHHRYMSLNAMLSRTLSRKDDLVALGHVLMFLLRGSLPWSGAKGRDYFEKYTAIMHRKKTLPVSELCQGYPEVFERFLSYSRGLKFDERPQYNCLVETFKQFRRDSDPPTDEWNLPWIGYVDPATVVPIPQYACAPQPEDSAETGSLEMDSEMGIEKLDFTEAFFPV